MVIHLSMMKWNEKKRNLTINSKVLEFTKLLCIRILYSILTVQNLSGRFYAGTGGYHIDFVGYKEAISLLVFLFVTVVYLNNRYTKHLAGLLGNLLYIIYYIPINASYSLNNTTTCYFILSNMFFIMLLITISKVDRINKRIEKESEPIWTQLYGGKILRVLEVFCLVICILFIMYKITYNGLKFNLSFDDVYDRREVRSIYLIQYSRTIVGYAIALLSSLVDFVNPLYLYISLERKRIMSSLIAFISILSQFSVSSNKGSVLIVIVVLYVLWCEKKNKTFNIAKNVRSGVLILFLMCEIEFLLTGFSNMYSFFVRRILYIPSWLNYLYFDFFSVNKKILFSDSTFLLQMFIDKKYQYTPIQLISKTYFNGAMPSPNTGLFAEAYMQLGVIGLFLFQIIYFYFLLNAQKIYKKIGLGFETTIAIGLALKVTNVPILRTDFMLSYVLATVIISFGMHIKMKN